MNKILRRVHARANDESGAIIIMAMFLMVVLFGAVAFTIDLSRLFHERQVLQNAVDFGALAGAQELPAQGSTQGAIASAKALQVTLDNAPWIDPATISITFKCVVGDRDGDGAPDLADVPYICGPSTGTWLTDWKTKRGRSQHTCNPYIGDKCNTVSVRTSETVNYIFAPVIGIDQGSTGSVSAASCRGACGAQPNPLDVVMVIDRTGSMTTADLANAKNAARSVLDFYDSTEHHVGVVALPYGRPTDKCNANDPQLYPQAAASFWSDRAAELGLRPVGWDAQYIEPDRHGHQLPQGLAHDRRARERRRQDERRPHEPRRSAGRRSRDAAHAGSLGRARHHHLHDRR